MSGFSAWEVNLNLMILIRKGKAKPFGLIVESSTGLCRNSFLLLGAGENTSAEQTLCLPGLALCLLEWPAPCVSEGICAIHRGIETFTIRQDFILKTQSKLLRTPGDKFHVLSQN